MDPYHYRVMFYPQNVDGLVTDTVVIVKFTAIPTTLHPADREISGEILWSQLATLFESNPRFAQFIENTRKSLEQGMPVQIGDSWPGDLVQQLKDIAN